ncbi:unnamed protein product [Closterium sp. NIES-54]
MPVVAHQGPVHHPPPLFPSPCVASGGREAARGGATWGGARRPFFCLLWCPGRPHVGPRSPPPPPQVASTGDGRGDLGGARVGAAAPGAAAPGAAAPGAAAPGAAAPGAAAPGPLQRPLEQPLLDLGSRLWPLEQPPLDPEQPPLAPRAAAPGAAAPGPQQPPLAPGAAAPGPRDSAPGPGAAASLRCPLLLPPPPPSSSPCCACSRGKEGMGVAGMGVMGGMFPFPSSSFVSHYCSCR